MQIKSFKEALAHRRSYYSISNQSPLGDGEIKKILDTALLNVPSAFNSQSTRVVLLLGKEHQKLWDIVKETLRKILPAEAFGKTEEKINHSFASGYGTVLFFEDQGVVQKLQEDFPLYKEKFPDWSMHTSGMHQLAVWTMLEEAGLGASLQHYNPLIDQEVRDTWQIPSRWTLIAQMPFGSPAEKPGEKTHEPLDERIKVYG